MILIPDRRIITPDRRIIIPPFTLPGYDRYIEPRRLLTYVQKPSAVADASNTTVTVTAVSTTAGSLLVAWCKWEGVLSGSTVSVMEGAGAFTAGTVQAHSNGDLNGQFHYKLVAAGGDTSIVATWTAARPWKAMHVWEFTYSGTCTLDTQIASAQGSTNTPSSGNITTTGTDEVVLGGLGIYASQTWTAGPLINGVAADQSVTGNQAHHSWERILTATFAGGAASGTSSNNQPWVCHAIAFKVAAGGGGTFQKLAGPRFRLAGPGGLAG